MSLSDSKARINAAHRDLMNAWYKVSDVWRDDTARAGCGSRSISEILSIQCKIDFNRLVRLISILPPLCHLATTRLAASS